MARKAGRLAAPCETFAWCTRNRHAAIIRTSNQDEVDPSGGQGNDIRIYVNGSLAHQLADDEAVSNYHKYGCYGTVRTGAATVKWRAARFFRDGHP